MPTQIYGSLAKPLTPDQIVSFRTEASAHGIVVPLGDSGEVQGPYGVIIDFVYDGAAVLTLTIKDKPWYIPASKIFDDLQGFLN